MMTGSTGSTTSAGSTIAISAALPATFDADGFGDLTFTTIGGVEKLGTIGAVYAKVEFQPLSGPKEKHKGSKDNGSLAPSMSFIEDDAGQTLMRTASDSNNNYSFEVTYPTGAIRYFYGRVFGMPEDTEGADSIIMTTPTIEINSDIVRVDAA
jgi:hypothetical protein